MMRKIIKRTFHLYDLDDLLIGGNCGLCGKWVSDEITLKKCDGWTICKECEQEN